MLKFDGGKDFERRRRAERSEPVYEALGQDGQALEGPIYAGKQYRKRTSIFAVQLAEEFEVTTLEGLHRGKAGDWLAMGIAGELYPIDQQVFQDSYELVED